MVYVIDKVFKSTVCPKYLSVLADSFCNAACYVFYEEGELERFASSIRSRIKAMAAKHPGLSFQHDRTYARTSDESKEKVVNKGSLSVVYRYNASTVVFLRMSYFRLYGHVVVSYDGLTLRQEPFFTEGGRHV